MNDLLAQSFQTHEGTVSDVGADGYVGVEVGEEDPVPCRLLQTSEAAPLVLAPGDTVVVATAPGGTSGFVLGRVALHRPADRAGEVQAPDARERHVEIVMPEGVDTVRIAGRRVSIAADEELTLECGGASVRIDRNGKVVVLGKDITTRARRLNKIKGARVAIN